MWKRLKMSGALGLVILALAVSPGVRAQSPEDSGRSIIWYESVQGSSSSLGQVTRFDSTLGYNFSKHFGVDIGVPVLFVRASSSTTSGLRSANGIGNVYTDVRFSFRNPAVNFVSTVTGSAPTGDSKLGFSSGRATFDWNNHFDRTLGRVTPYANLGIANTVSDTAYFVRPFTTLGLAGHFEGGARVNIWRFLSFRASGYAIEPSGQQKVFSKFLSRPSGSSGNPAGHGRVFQTSPETVGSADLTRDHGFSVGFEASPMRFVDFALGYTHSASFSLDTIYFGVGFNLAHFLGGTSH